MKWELRFIQMAQLVASWSKDPSTKVGAVITTADRRVVSTGYNGFARGVDDTPERLNDRTLKYPLTIHAELNAILSAAYSGHPLRGCTIYVSPLHPCSQCASAIVQAGITSVVFSSPTMLDSDAAARWDENFRLAAGVFREAGVEIRRIV